jgi:hypothetical protein
MITFILCIFLNVVTEEIFRKITLTNPYDIDTYNENKNKLFYYFLHINS